MDDSARGEAARQAVALVAMTIATVVLVVVERKASEPDAWRTVRMVSARECERAAASAAARLWQVAERARLLYESERA